jgi:hypothetical protein
MISQPVSFFFWLLLLHPSSIQKKHGRRGLDHTCTLLGFVRLMVGLAHQQYSKQQQQGQIALLQEALCLGHRIQLV